MKIGFTCGAIALLSCAGLATEYTVPDAELLVPDFGKMTGYSGSTSTLDAKVDVAGPGVQFRITLSGSDSGKIGIGDPWPTNSAAGLGWDSVLGHWTSLAAYDGYQMTIQYVNGPVGSDIDVSLIMNTGLTGPSGNPPNDPTNDTFWQSRWITLRLGESRVITLGFDGAEAWNIADNKPPHTGGGLNWLNGGTYIINDRDRNEVSNIGLQFADFDGDALGSQIGIYLNAGLCDVSGTILLDGYRGGPGISSTMEFRWPDSQEVRSTVPITLDSSGHFSAPGVPPGTYDVAVKFGNWLRQVRRAIVLAYPSATLDFALTNGDANGDNVVNLLDLSVVLSRFGTSGPAGDLNVDASVNLLDLSIVLANFGRAGDQ